MATPEAADVLLMLIRGYDQKIQQQIVDLLKLLFHYRTNIDARVFLPLMIDILERSNETEQDNPVSLETLYFLRSAFDYYMTVQPHHASSVLRSLTIRWLSDPTNLKFVRNFFWIADSLIGQVDLHSAIFCFNWVSDIFNTTFCADEPQYLELTGSEAGTDCIIRYYVDTEDESVIDETPDPDEDDRNQALCWLAAGIMAMMALTHDCLLQELVNIWLPRICSLQHPSMALVQSFLRTSELDHSRLKIMEAIGKASVRFTEMLETRKRELHELMTRQNSWAFHEILRNAMENISAVVEHDKALTALTPAEVALLLHEHGFSEERAKIVTLTGAQLYAAPSAAITAQYRLTPEERSMIEDIQSTYRYMREITNDNACTRVTPQQMRWYLHPLRESPHRDYLPLIFNCHSMDGFYYLHNLITRRACLDFFTAPPNP